MGEEAGGAASGSSGRGAERLLARLRGDRSFGRGFGTGANRNSVYRGPGVRLFFDAYQILIWDFPAEVLVLSALLEILFEENGAAGIGHESAGRGQKDIAGAILHLHATPEKGGVASHPVLSVGGG
jgi:hypothetical protein